MKYAIHVELEYEATGDPYERAHYLLRQLGSSPVLGPFVTLAHYHFLGAPRKLDEERDEEARRTEEDAQPYWNNE